MFGKLYFLFFLIQRISFATEHTYGDIQAGDKLLFEKELFARNESFPKNFTIIFKYIASEQSPNITCAKFNIENAISNVTFDVNTVKDQERTLQTVINVVNGEKFNVIGRIYGSSVSLLGASALQILPTFTSKQTTPKTFTVIYGHNATQSRNQHVILGERQTGDKQIAFESKNVTFTNRFAEQEFNYRDEHKHITLVKFSFDSPTAIAFVNSTFIREHSVNVIAYDLNRPWFMANMSIYGYDDFDKPPTYKPIVLAQSKKYEKNLYSGI